MSTMPFPLSLLCDVSVTVTPAGVNVPTFNQGIIIGTSGVIPSVGANSRVREYAASVALAQMILDGFSPTDPEYIAVSLYIAPNPKYTPPEFVWVGCQDPTAIAAEGLTASHGGTGYAVNDVSAVTQGGASGGYVKVTSVNAGVVTGVAIVPGNQGTGYAVAGGLATTNVVGTGTGLEVDISAIGETALQALTACRLVQPAWYTAMVCGAADADHVACAQYAQTAQPAMQYLYGTQSLSALQGTTGNVFSLIKAANYRRAHGAYSTTQSGAAPNNLYVAAAVSGMAMGRNNGQPNSSFALANSRLDGIIPEPITPSQAGVFAGLPGQGKGNNGNVLINFGNSYPFYEQGLNGDGSWFDQVLILDMLAADCQISVLNAVDELGNIPQDDAGQSIIINAVLGACARSAERGSIASGVWEGPTILKLTPGTTLPTGYQAQSQSFLKQSPSDRNLRKGMPVYVAVILAGTQQSFTIAIDVQQ